MGHRCTDGLLHARSHGGVGLQCLLRRCDRERDVAGGHRGQGDCVGGVGKRRDDTGGGEEVSGHRVDEIDQCGRDHGVGHQVDHGVADLFAHDRTEFTAAEQG